MIFLVVVVVVVVGVVGVLVVLLRQNGCVVFISAYRSPGCPEFRPRRAGCGLGWRGPGWGRRHTVYDWICVVGRGG